MLRTAKLGLLIVTCGWLSASAAEPVPVDEAAIKELLQRVDSNQASERAAAAGELQSLGPAILPHLPPPERMDSAAARDLVVHIRNVLERQVATESARAATVSLQKTAPPADLIVAIWQQTGNNLEWASDSSQAPLTVHWEAKPFWEAVDDLAHQT